MLRTIVVNGEGQVTATPDQARLTAGVVTQGRTAAAALDANTGAMTNVYAALKQLGVPENKIQTSNFSLNPQYTPITPNNPQLRNIAGYQVSNQVTVVLSDTSKAGSMLDALVRNGANQSYGLSFEFADPKPLIQRARSAAVADAIAKAKTLADAAGIALGLVLSIQEGVEYQPVRPLPEQVLITGSLVRGATPVSVGEDNVTVNVTMTYGIQ